MAHSYLNVTSSGQVKTGSGVIYAAVLTASSDTATLILYDNTAGSGTIIAKLSAVANTSATINLEGAAFNKGVYAALTGTSPSATIIYR